MKCQECNGYGQVAIRNNFAPCLSSVLAARCPECDGTGLADADYGDYREPEGGWAYYDEWHPDWGRF